MRIVKSYNITFEISADNFDNQQDANNCLDQLEYDILTIMPESLEDARSIADTILANCLNSYAEQPTTGHSLAVFLAD
jgi:hypothetical protein